MCYLESTPLSPYSTKHPPHYWTTSTVLNTLHSTERPRSTEKPPQNWNPRQTWKVSGYTINRVTNIFKFYMKLATILNFLVNSSIVFPKAQILPKMVIRYHELSCMCDLKHFSCLTSPLLFYMRFSTGVACDCNWNRCADLCSLNIWITTGKTCLIRMIMHFVSVSVPNGVSSSQVMVV